LAALNLIFTHHLNIDSEVNSRIPCSPVPSRRATLSPSIRPCGLERAHESHFSLRPYYDLARTLVLLQDHPIMTVSSHTMPFEAYLRDEAEIVRGDTSTKKTFSYWGLSSPVQLYSVTKPFQGQYQNQQYQQHTLPHHSHSKYTCTFVAQGPIKPSTALLSHHTNKIRANSKANIKDQQYRSQGSAAPQPSYQQRPGYQSNDPASDLATNGGKETEIFSAIQCCHHSIKPVLSTVNHLIKR